MAWRISQGALLYDQLANWYGPLAQLVEAAGSRLFGVGMDTIFGMNIALTAGILFLIRAIFGTIGNRLTVWLCSVVFVLVFMVGSYRIDSNYSYIAPYSAQATYGLAGLLIVVWALLRHLKSERGVWLFVAGGGLAVAYLDKHEPLLAALGALGIYVAARVIRIVRQNTFKMSAPNAGRWLLGVIVWLASGFFSLWTPVFLFFASEGGVGYAFRATNRVVYTMLDPVFVNTVENSTFMRGLFGFDNPWGNFIVQLQAGALLLLVCAALALITWQWTKAQQFSSAWWGYLLAALAVAAGVCWANWHGPLQWIYLGRAIVFPVFIGGAVAAGWCGWSAWRGKGDFNHVLGVAMVGVAAALMFARMALHARIYHFGFFMAPLAVFFVIHLMTVEAARPWAGLQRANILLPAAFSLIVLCGAAFLGRANVLNYAKKTLEVGSGRDRFYTFESGMSEHGVLLQQMIKVVKDHAPGIHTLAAFPEASAVNYHLRLPSPLAETEFQPVSLAYVGQQHVLDELQAHPPDLIFLHYREMDEFGVKFFGADQASGLGIVIWINAHYVRTGFTGNTPDTFTGHSIDMYVRKPGE